MDFDLKLMEKIVYILQEHPERSVFLNLSLGFVMWQIKVGSFKIVVLGTLFVEVLIGNWTKQFHQFLKLFSSIFSFATDYKIGSHFFQGLEKMHGLN